MTSGDEGKLFAGLPEQPAPERTYQDKPRLRMAERRQVELRAICLDDLVPTDHRVRMVWTFVEGLDVSALVAAVKAVEGRPGHPPADPRILLALWLYATADGVGSARELARLCDEHIAYQWLCGGVGMNAKTLADFRVGHGEVLERLLVDSFTALVRAGVASLDRVAQDGMRVRAAAGAASFRRQATLQECRRQAEAAVRDLRAELERDPATASRRQAAARQRAAADRERRVREALAVTEDLRAEEAEKARKAAERAAEAAREEPAGPAPPGKRAKDKRPKEPRGSTTDPQARVMKMADGGFRPAYNVQFACDTTSGAIAKVSVDNVGSDMGKMAPMSEALADDYGQRPRQHLADGGFAKLADITALAQAGVETFVPVPTPRNAERDRYAPLPGDPPEVAAWRERMNTDDAKAIYKERASTVECANAQARNHGLTRFLVRGLEAVTATALWHALAQNMFCTWRLVAA
jgi:transposase